MLRRDPFADLDGLVRRVRAYVGYRIGDGPDADDLTSEVFERALRYRAGYDPAKGEPAAWLIGIAKQCIAGKKRRRADAPTPVDLAADGGGDFETEALRRLTIAAGVATLRARDRDLLALRFGADLTAAQMALVLGISTHAVEVGVQRALGRLRTALEDVEQPSVEVWAAPASSEVPATQV